MYHSVYPLEAFWHLPLCVCVPLHPHGDQGERCQWPDLSLSTLLPWGSVCHWIWGYLAASQLQPSSCLSPQGWRHRHAWSHAWLLTCVLGIWTQVPMHAQWAFFFNEPSSQSQHLTLGPCWLNLVNFTLTFCGNERLYSSTMHNT